MKSSNRLSFWMMKQQPTQMILIESKPIIMQNLKVGLKSHKNIVTQTLKPISQQPLATNIIKFS